MALLVSLSRAGRPRKALSLPLRTTVLTALTLTLNRLSIAALISGFVALGFTLKMTWFDSEASVAFSVMTGETMTS